LKKVLLIAGAVLSLAPAALAAPNSEGRFTRAFMRDNQPHRVYFRVACGGGDKTARVTLMMKTMEVSLRNGSPAVSEVEHFYYTREEDRSSCATAGAVGPRASGLPQELGALAAVWDRAGLQIRPSGVRSPGSLR
jgi:hypothetical protein